jgi:hypothetical protein
MSTDPTSSQSSGRASFTVEHLKMLDLLKQSGWVEPTTAEQVGILAAIAAAGFARKHGRGYFYTGPITRGLVRRTWEAVGRLPRRNKIVLAGVTCLGLLTLVVPWRYSVYEPGRGYADATGYSFVFLPPTPSASLQWPRIILPMSFVVCATIAGIYLTKDRPQVARRSSRRRRTRQPGSRDTEDEPAEPSAEEEPESASANRSTLHASQRWTEEEKTNLAHFKYVLKVFDNLAATAESKEKISPRAKEIVIRYLLHDGLREAALVRDDVLAKAHPGLSAAFREKLVRWLELTLESRKAGKPSQGGTTLAQDWSDWWRAHASDMQILKDIPDLLSEEPTGQASPQQRSGEGESPDSLR